MIEFQCADGVAELVALPGGLLITPWHPVRVQGAWRFPADLGNATSQACKAVYAILLGDGSDGSGRGGNEAEQLPAASIDITSADGSTDTACTTCASGTARVTTGTKSDAARLDRGSLNVGAVDEKEVVAVAVEVNGVECAVLGHGIAGDPVASHAFFGCRARVCEVLEKAQGWGRGRVTFRPGCFLREAVTANADTNVIGGGIGGSSGGGGLVCGYDLTYEVVAS